MNNRKIRTALSLLWIALGCGLLAAGSAGLLDEYWSGMGGALLAVGCLQLIRHLRYRTDTDYRERVDVAEGDERNRYIAGKAWAWAGYWFVLIAAASTIVLKIAGREDLVPVAGGSVGLIVFLYWVSYLCLQKKY